MMKDYTSKTSNGKENLVEGERGGVSSPFSFLSFCGEKTVCTVSY